MPTIAYRHGAGAVTDDEAELRLALHWLDDRARERAYPAAEVAGITLGGCADALGTSRVGAMRKSAHAHADPGDPLRGWLCFKAHGVVRLVSSTGLPTAIFRHEYAHLLAADGHGPRWRRAVAALGAAAEAKPYERRAQDRRARLANTTYYVAGEPVDRAAYLAAHPAGRR